MIATHTNHQKLMGPSLSPARRCEKQARILRRIGTLLASWIVGTVLVFQHDEARIVIGSLTLLAVGARREPGLAALGAVRPAQGVALSVRF